MGEYIDDLTYSRRMGAKEGLRQKYRNVAQRIDGLRGFRSYANTDQEFVQMIGRHIGQIMTRLEGPTAQDKYTQETVNAYVCQGLPGVLEMITKLGRSIRTSDNHG
jgi:hypothetical protein